MAWTLRQGQNGTCFTCGTCGGASIGTPTCVSRAGNASLCGWSKYQNHNSGDWNTRKGTTRAFSGGWSYRDYESTDCGSNCATGCDVTFSGAATRNCGGSTGTGLRSGDAYEFGCEFQGSSSSNISSLSDGSQCAGVATSESLADFSRTLDATQACEEDPPGISSSASGSALEVLTTFDSVAAALARGTPTVGSSCKTTAGTIGSTTAQSTTNISITSTTAVTVTIPLSGLTPAADYTIDININRYSAGGGSFVDSIVDTVSFTAGAASEDLTYEVPVNTDYDYEFSSATNLVAA